MRILLSDDQLKDLLSKSGISTKDKILFCLAADPAVPKQTRDIKEVAFRCGYNDIPVSNISTYLHRNNGLAIKTTAGWELTSDGKNSIREKTGDSPVVSVSPTLRKIAEKIADVDTKNFVLEAIACFEAHHYRAAVVLSWVGAISVLYEHVLTDAALLAAVNTEALARNAKWKTAKNKDDRACMNEYTFLEILVKLSVIGKSVKNELFNCLKFRNGCGHPNSMIIGEHRVSGHIEFLVQNVYSKF